MTLTAHIAIGSAIGLATANPAVAFLFGWVSHHFADAIPHSDLGSVGANVENVLSNRKELKIVFVDILLSIAIFIIYILKSDRDALVFWGAFGGMFPDVVDNSPFWSPWLRKRFPFNVFHFVHEKIHTTIKNRKILWLGLLTQVVAVILSLCYLFVW